MRGKSAESWVVSSWFHRSTRARAAPLGPAIGSRRPSLRRGPRRVRCPSCTTTPTINSTRGIRRRRDGDRPSWRRSSPRSSPRVAVFFVLRALDERGLPGRPRRRHRPGSQRPRRRPPARARFRCPNVVGVRLEQARELLKARGLLISDRRGARRSPTARRAASCPRTRWPARRSQPGTTVQVAVARAVSSVIVPPLAGLKPDEAIAPAGQQGPAAGPAEGRAPASRWPPGLVAGSEPAAGRAGAARRAWSAC